MRQPGGSLQEHDVNGEVPSTTSTNSCKISSSGWLLTSCPSAMQASPRMVAVAVSSSSPTGTRRRGRASYGGLCQEDRRGELGCAEVGSPNNIPLWVRPVGFRRGVSNCLYLGRCVLVVARWCLVACWSARRLWCCSLRVRAKEPSFLT